MPQGWVRLDHVEPGTPPMQGGDDHRHDRRETQRLVSPFGVVHVDHRRQAKVGDRQHCAELRQHWSVLSGHHVDHGEQIGGDLPELRQRPSELDGFAGVRQATLPHEEPDLLERTPASEGRGIVGAVVEEAAIAVDRADCGVGGDHAVESGGNVDQLCHASECPPRPLQNQR